MADDTGGGPPRPQALIVAFCKRCCRGTISVPHPECGGPACAGCGRCPGCDGDTTEAGDG